MGRLGLMPDRGGRRHGRAQLTPVVVVLWGLAEAGHRRSAHRCGPLSLSTARLIKALLRLAAAHPFLGSLVAVLELVVDLDLPDSSLRR